MQIIIFNKERKHFLIIFKNTINLFNLQDTKAWIYQFLIKLTEKLLK